MDEVATLVVATVVLAMVVLATLVVPTLVVGTLVVAAVVVDGLVVVLFAVVVLGPVVVVGDVVVLFVVVVDFAVVVLDELDDDVDTVVVLVGVGLVLLPQASSQPPTITAPTTEMRFIMGAGLGVRTRIRTRSPG
jgi:hypothetical protein